MKTLSTQSRYGRSMDTECLRLCDAINLIPGIRTVESCCGHGKDQYRIWIEAESLEALPSMLYWFDGCHCGHYGWRVIVLTDCAMSPVTFMVEGPVGEEAYRQAEKIAVLIEGFNAANLKKRAYIFLTPG